VVNTAEAGRALAEMHGYPEAWGECVGWANQKAGCVVLPTANAPGKDGKVVRFSGGIGGRVRDE
jgi:hypothetical protein